MSGMVSTMASYGTFLRKTVCFLSMDQCQLQAIIVGILTVKDELGVI